MEKLGLAKQRRKHDVFVHGESDISPRHGDTSNSDSTPNKKRIAISASSALRWCSPPLTLGSHFTSVSLIFSRCATAVITCAVIQENKAKCSLFTYDFLSDDNDNGVTLSSAASTRIAPVRGGTLAEETLRSTPVHPRMAKNAGSWNFYERPVSKFLTLRKIRYFAVRDRRASLAPRCGNSNPTQIIGSHCYYV